MFCLDKNETIVLLKKDESNKYYITKNPGTFFDL